MLYSKIVDYFIENINKGSILPGEKLPSLRKIADQFGVSLSTAVEAYRRLELYGYVSAKDRSGYQALLPSSEDSYLQISKNFKSKVSEITHVDEITNLYLQAQDKNFAPFGIATPDPEKLPNKMITRAMAWAIKSVPDVHGRYLFGKGLLELRHELAKWMRPWIGITSADNILITSGCIEALNIALATHCKSGDIVAVESPCYFGILQAIHNHNLQTLEVKTDPKEGLDPEALEILAKKHKIKVLISTANVQNPTGYTMTDKRKKEVLAVCFKYGIRIIEDDIYGEVAFNNVRAKSYKYFDKNSIVTYCSSFSKSIGPGLRVGWCIPSENMDEAVRLKLNLNLTTSLLTQLTVLRILKKENILKITHHSAKYYENNIQIYSSVIQNQLEGQVAISRPTGHFFLWMKVNGLDATTALEKARKHKLSFTPGPLFSATKQFGSYLRINCAHEFTEERNNQLIKLCQILKDVT